MGTYSGSFNKGIITLVLNYISGKTVSGYDIHKGLRRNVNGEVSRDGGKLSFVLKEPGDNPYDGVFYFSLDTASLKINGKWVPMDSSKLSTKKLALSRKKVDKSMEDYGYLWTSFGKGDTSLEFHQDGSCDLSFYQLPEDSTSQLIDIQGSYIINKDTFRIEWQKNDYFPSTLMKLVRSKEKMNEGEEGFPVLGGNGLKFTPFEGD